MLKTRTISCDNPIINVKKNPLCNVKISYNINELSDIDSDCGIDDIINNSLLKNKILKISRPPPIVVYSYLRIHVASLNNIRSNLNELLTAKQKANRILIHTSNKDDYE